MLLAAVRPSRNGVRPNSPPMTTSVSSSRPRCSRSLIRAATGRSIVLHLFVRPSRMSSPGLVPWKSQPQSNSCTKRTPFSTSRRARRIVVGEAARAGLGPVAFEDRLRLAGDVHHLGHRDLHAEGQLVLRDARERLGMAELLGPAISFRSRRASRRHAAHRRGPCRPGWKRRAPGRPCERHCTPW